MSQYLCLGYYNEQKFKAMSKAEVADIVKQCAPHDAALRATGRMSMVGSLAFPAEAISIRPRNGKPVVTDGPFTEAKEIVGSFWLIEAKDREEAISIASKHPAAHLGEHIGWGVEVWPIGQCQALATE